MKRRKVIKVTSVLFLLTAALVLAQSPRPTGRAYEKICPISFQLYPGTLLERNYAAKIEKDNAKLSVFIGELRAIIMAEKGRTPFDAAGWLQHYLKTEGAVNPFDGTYLTHPKLTNDKRVVFEGISAVVGELARIVQDSTYIDAQSVQVYLEYLPFNSPEFNAANPAGTPPDRQIDIIAHVKTVLAYAPYDDPMVIEGPLPHRRVCDPGY